MKLLYRTGWPAASMHYRVAGSQSWCTEPLAAVPGAPDWMSIEPKQEVGEFVMCNLAKTEWDNPPPEVGTQNYVVADTNGSSHGRVTYTLTGGVLRRWRASEPVLVVSDLDHTMVGHERDPDDALLQEFRSVWLGRHAFSGSRLVYSTGRNKSDALQVAREKGLLRPSLLVCGVGTEIYNVPDDLPLGPSGAWAEEPWRITLDEGWRARMVETFDRAAVEELLRERFPQFEIRGNLETDPYRIPGAYKVNPDMEEDFKAVRAAVGPTVEVIRSGGSEWKLVDFCSASAGKLMACRFVMEDVFGFSPEKTLVCGDSGNDESMYRCPSVRGVAVGNALPELVEILGTMANAGPVAVQQGAVFRTKLESEVLYAGRPVAAGIVEALERFFSDAK